MSASVRRGLLLSANSRTREASNKAFENALREFRQLLLGVKGDEVLFEDGTCRSFAAWFLCEWWNFRFMRSRAMWTATAQMLCDRIRHLRQKTTTTTSNMALQETDDAAKTTQRSVCLLYHHLLARMLWAQFTFDVFDYKNLLRQLAADEEMNEILDEAARTDLFNQDYMLFDPIGDDFQEWIAAFDQGAWCDMAYLFSRHETLMHAVDELYRKRQTGNKSE
jgi:hypothetical protein